MESMSAECRTRNTVSSTHVACQPPYLRIVHPLTLSYHFKYRRS